MKIELSTHTLELRATGTPDGKIPVLYHYLETDSLMTREEVAAVALVTGCHDIAEAMDIVSCAEIAEETEDEEYDTVSEAAVKLLEEYGVTKSIRYIYSYEDSKHQLTRVAIESEIEDAEREAEAYNEFKDDGEEKICYGVTVNLPIYEKSRRTYNWRNGASTPVEYDLGNPFGDEE